MVAETRDAEHARKMKEMLMSKYTSISITGVGEALGLDDDASDTQSVGFKGFNLGLQPLPEDESLPTTGNNSRKGSILLDDHVLSFGGLSVPVITSARRGSIRQAVGTLST